MLVASKSHIGYSTWAYVTGSTHHFKTRSHRRGVLDAQKPQAGDPQNRAQKVQQKAAQARRF